MQEADSLGILDPTNI